MLLLAVMGNGGLVRLASLQGSQSVPCRCATSTALMGKPDTMFCCTMRRRLLYPRCARRECHRVACTADRTYPGDWSESSVLGTGEPCRPLRGLKATAGLGTAPLSIQSPCRGSACSTCCCLWNTLHAVLFMEEVKPPATPRVTHTRLWHAVGTCHTPLILITVPCMSSKNASPMPAA